MLKHSKSSSSFNLKSEDCMRLPSEETQRSKRVSPTIHHEKRTEILGAEFNKQQMRNIREKCLLKMIMKKMYAMIPLSKTPFKIYEEWEMDDDDLGGQAEMDNQTFDEKVFSLHPMYQVLSFIQGLNVLIFLWSISIALVFQYNVVGLGSLAIISIEIINIIVKIRLLKSNKSLLRNLIDSKSKEIINPLLIIIGSVIAMVHGYNRSAGSIIANILIVPIMIFVSFNVFQFFEVAKIYAEEKKLIKEMRIVELFCVLFLLAHIFGLILYSAIYITPEGSNCWINLPNLNLANKSLIIKYIYSIYWAMTTTITVGFGDITPQNYIEIIIVMFIQICGTSFFGYMISVIGGIVDKRNMKNEEYDNYQETIMKLKDHYSLSQELCHKMKSDIKDKYNKQKSTPLKKIEETEFLEYIDALVKKDFIHETNIRIVKKSIFFLTYFTTHFQNEIALKLIRAIYKKEDSIYTKDEVTNERKLIIINHGRINLFIEKKHSNISCKKLVKTIETIEGKPTLNVYGYSSLILNKDIALFANAETITSGYQLRLSDVLEIIAKSMVDYETFHEMRERMLVNPIKQSVEAPILKEPSYHYTPNVFILSKKENKKFYQERNKKSRSHRRKQLELIDVISFINFKRKMTKQFNDDEISQRNNQLKQKFKMYSEFESLISIEDEPNCESMISTQKLREERLSLQLNIDQIKIFDHFLKTSNINHLAAKYEQSCKKESYKKRILTKLIIQ